MDSSIGHCTVAQDDYRVDRCAPPETALRGWPERIAATPASTCSSETTPMTWPTTRPSPVMKKVSGMPVTPHSPATASV